MICVMNVRHNENKPVCIVCCHVADGFCAVSFYSKVRPSDSCSKSLPVELNFKPYLFLLQFFLCSLSLLRSLMLKYMQSWTLYVACILLTDFCIIMYFEETNLFHESNCRSTELYSLLPAFAARELFDIVVSSHGSNMYEIKTYSPLIQKTYNKYPQLLIRISLN